MAKYHQFVEFEKGPMLEIPQLCAHGTGYLFKVLQAIPTTRLIG